MVSTAFPITLQLTFVGILVAVVAATVLGVVTTLYRDRMPDQVIRVILFSLPGQGDVLLSELFLHLQINRSVTDVDTVVFSDENLLFDVKGV